MKEEYLRLPDVAKLCAIAKPTVWKWIKTRKFPKQIKLTSRVSVWKKSEVQAWMDTQIELALS